MKNLNGILRVLTREHSETPLHDVHEEHVREWALSRSTNSNTKQTYLRCLRVLFDFSKRQGWVSENPCDRIENVTIDQKTPEILTAYQTRKVLEWARKERPDSLAMFALGIFAGVRPTELSRIGWGAINLDRGELLVDGAAAKTRRRRIVHLEPACVAWLRIAKEIGSELPFREKLRMWRQREARHLLGLPRWTQDLMRHTAASYGYALHRDAGRVAANLGNTPAILLKHYRELVTTEAAAEFWNILPTP